MKATSIQTLAAAIGCRCGDNRFIDQISTDSRTAKPGCLFVCIEGERFDGHSYARQAAEKGAAFFVAHKPLRLPDSQVFYVRNTLAANIALSGAYRRQFSLLSVGITGSVGKTTTKEFTAAVLSRKWKTLKTEGNHNNEIGVPATLLQLEESYEAMVVEMGMNARGDIDLLSRAVQPNIGVITAIGTSHIERLGSRENILSAKMEIADSLPDGAPLILNGDDDLLSGVNRGRLRVLRFGIENSACDYRAVNIREEGASFDVVCPAGRYPVRIPTIGRHHVLDALAAFAVGIEAGVEPEAAAAGLGDYQAAGMRQKVVHASGLTVVEDCYNASPDSMYAALDTLSRMQGRKIAVLGDMLELGETSHTAHDAVGRRCARVGVDLFYCLGEFAQEMRHGAEEAGLKQVQTFQDKKALARELARAARPGDIIWFKASRGIRLEEAIEAFYKEIKGEE